MSTVLSRFLRLLTGRNVFRKSSGASCVRSSRRHFADTTATTDSSSKKDVVQGTEKEERVRVRRARASDVPRVLRFVRENARLAFPVLGASPGPTNVMLDDYVARALAQGHSMLAEQQESQRGWPQLRGLALSASLCPWDAAVLERWARCVHCARSRRLVNFTAHCLRAPALHDKYRVHNILQVVFIVPENTPKTSEIVHDLAKNTIQRGKDVGIPLIRFDVSNDFISKTLESLQLKKEWQLSYEILPNTTKGKNSDHSTTQRRTTAYEPSDNKNQIKGSFITVYTVFPDSYKP